ncbi:MAG: tRNA (adenosine(37)-N6)-dimethylallyltransferase MiaA [Parcubacteria group bacterium]
MSEKNKVLVILGPTAVGKSNVSVKLAKKLKGEIISADSRQVYRGLNIGTGKITRKEMGGIPHHLLDVADPKKQFTAFNYAQEARKALTMIYHSGKLPIVVGGTGFYIDVLVGMALPEVPPNKLLRKKFDKLSKEKLYEMLKQKDPDRAKSIDRNNKLRLIRALEIVKALGKVPKLTNNKQQTTYNFIYIGIKTDKEELEKRIYKRLIKRLPGMIREVKNLRRQKLSWKRLHELGLEYRYIAIYLRGKLSKEEMTAELYKEIKRYSKRQMTWFKRNKSIKWFRPTEFNSIERYVRMALKGD